MVVSCQCEGAADAAESSSLTDFLGFCSSLAFFFSDGVHSFSNSIVNVWWYIVKTGVWTQAENRVVGAPWSPGLGMCSFLLRCPYTVKATQGLRLASIFYGQLLPSCDESRGKQVQDVYSIAFAPLWYKVGGYCITRVVVSDTKCQCYSCINKSGEGRCRFK